MSRLNSLLSESRMGKESDNTNPVNRLEGLLDLINENFNSEFVIVEIGNYQGVSTELFALHCKKVYAIDPYDETEYFGQETRKQVIQAEEIFIERMQAYDNVIKLKESSEQAAKNFMDKTLDAVYIDGDHRNESVIRDIKLWMPKIKECGYICGHDYYEEIEKTINSVLGIQHKIYKDNSWIQKI